MSAETPGTSGSGDEVLRHIELLHETMGATGIGPVEFSGRAITPLSTPEDDSIDDDRRFSLETAFGDKATVAYNQLATLKQAIAVDRKNHPQYIDEGSRCCVLHLPDVGARQPLVAKMPRPDRTDQETCFTRMLYAFTRGRGIPGATQMVAYSHELQTAVLKYVDGDVLSAPGARERLTLRSFRNLLRTYRGLQQENLVPDNFSARNTKVTPRGDLVVVDYDYQPRHTLEEKALLFGSENALLFDGFGTSGDPLPRYAQAYRTVCYQEFGMDMVEMLNSQWRSYGLVVPPFRPQA